MKKLPEVQGARDMRSWNACYYIRTLQTSLSLSLGGPATTALVAVPVQHVNLFLPLLYSLCVVIVIDIFSVSCERLTLRVGVQLELSHIETKTVISTLILLILPITL